MSPIYKFLMSSTVILALSFSTLWAQTVEEDLGATWVPADAPASQENARVAKPSAETYESTSSSAQNKSDATSSKETFVGPKTTRYSLELTGLPNAEGQFWVVYDLSPYSERLPNVNAPQSTIVDWIMFDSGDEFWRKEPFCILSATSQRLYVYHNEKVQRYVSNIVDRFIDPAKKDASVSIKVVALQNPEWRLRYSDILNPHKVSIIGNGCDAQGWELNRTELEKIEKELAQKTDYTALSDENHIIPNGQTYGWANAAPRKNFARDYRLDSSLAAGYSTDISSVDEGFSIETTPLFSTSGESLEVMFRYRSTAIEKMRSFGVRVPTANSPRQQLNVERPSIATCDVRGKISLSRDKAAIIDLGMVPLIPPGQSNATPGFIENTFNLVSQKTVFYDALILIGGSN